MALARGLRSAITLTVLCVALAVAALWGWQAATEPLPAKVDTPICVTKQVPAGTKVFPEDVTVSVYNAGTRDGLDLVTWTMVHGFAALALDGFLPVDAGELVVEAFGRLALVSDPRPA